MKTAIVAGTTGLIGSQLTELLLADDYYHRIIALSRKPLKIDHPKLQNVITDFDKLEEISSQLKGDDVFCCLGTTIKVARSKAAFYKVDHDYPVTLASITKREGAKQFLIVTASGSNKRSAIFYNQVKGQVEEDVIKIGFESMHIFQPSLLVGPRIEKRTGEEIIQSTMKVLGFIIPKKYRAIDSIRVARAMISVAHSEKMGLMIHGSAELQNY